MSKANQLLNLMEKKISEVAQELADKISAVVDRSKFKGLKFKGVKASTEGREAGAEFYILVDVDRIYRHPQDYSRRPDDEEFHKLSDLEQAIHKIVSEYEKQFPKSEFHQVGDTSIKGTLYT